jgi:hypothetical protein
MQRVDGRWLEVEPHVKSSRLLVERMNEYRSHGDNFGGRFSPQHRILEQGPPQTLAFSDSSTASRASSTTPNRMAGRSFCHSQGRFLPVYTTGGERIIPHHAVLPMRHIGGCQIALLVAPGETLQPIVERFDPAGELGKIVVLRQLLCAGERNVRHSASFQNGRLHEQFSQLWSHPRRPLQRFIEGLPLHVRQKEMHLIRNRLFRPRAGAFQDEIRHADAAPVGGCYWNS